MAARKQREQDGEAEESGRGEPRRRQRPQGEQELDLDSLREHGRALREAAGELRDATQQALSDAESMARSGVRQHPYTLLGAAFAAGWVLGGGVPLRIATLATGAVGRAALGLAAARLAEYQANGSAGFGERAGQKAEEAAPESGARAEV